MSPITSSDQIIEAARESARRSGKKMVAVAGADDGAVLEAVASAGADGIIEATLFGDRGRIQNAAANKNTDISAFEIVHHDDINKSLYEAVKLADEGHANVLMKGFVSTSALLRAVLSSDFNLRRKSTISHTALLDIPGYHKLLQMTDGGMVVTPTIEQRLQIMENAVLVGRVLGLRPVRVAFSGAYDGVYDDIATSREVGIAIARAAALDLDDVLIQGPLSFDAATSARMAALKGVAGPVAGDTDVYVVNTIEECNIIAKALINFADAVFAGVIIGAGVPVSLVSRTDTIKNKKAAISIACLIAEYYKKTGMEKNANDQVL